MNLENKPLYALSVEEFKKINKTIIDEALDEREKIKRSEVDITEEDKHFTITELATFLKCSKQSIHNYKNNGLPYYRIGRKVLFEKKKVLNFMKNVKSKKIVFTSSKL